jgi:hypothetical protein
MNSRDDKLTRKNVEAQIERCLFLLQDPQTRTMTSLSRTIQDLQSIYEEDRRLEHIWKRINSRVSALNALRFIQQREELSTALLAQSALQETRRTKGRSRWLLRLSCFIVGIVLVAAIILIAFFTWPIWSQALRGL